jgi:nitrate reductase NapAB chaperone NapD
VEVADPAAAPDGRLVIVIEDSAGSSAAATLGAIALWPEVLNTSLVYEYSGPDSPAPDGVAEASATGAAAWYPTPLEPAT